MKKNNGFGGRSQCGESEEKRKKREKRENDLLLSFNTSSLINIFHLRPPTVCKTKICSQKKFTHFATHRRTYGQTARRTDRHDVTLEATPS